MKKCTFIDGDGTLYLGNQLIEGAKTFLNALKRKNHPFFICTNNSSKTPLDYFQKYQTLGLDISQKNILISTHPAINYIKQKKYAQVYWVANTQVSQWLTSEGFTYNEINPECILLTYDTEITYKKLSLLTQLVRTNTPYYATHPDMVCPDINGSLPDIGTFIKTIELTTGKTPDKIFGKPNSEFILPTLKQLGLTLNDAMIIGDRLYTDIQMGHNNNLTTVLTLTGETTQALLDQTSIKPDIVVSNLLELL